jgi:FkbM family methyltransferase
MTDNPGAAFQTMRRLVRAIPDGLPGKTRLARNALRLFDRDRPVWLPDRFGNRLCCLSLREPIALGLFASGVYEPATVLAIVEALRPDGVFLDVGASIGAIALAVAAQRPGAKVVCIEASPDIAPVLRQNVGASDRANVTVIECLAGETERTGVAFYRAPAAKFGMGSIGPQFGAAPIALPQRTLDGILDELGIGAVDVVKLDIEGAELGALRGLARRLAAPKPPTIVFEFSDWAEARIPGQTPGAAQALLMALGYGLFSLPRGAEGEALATPLTTGAAMLLAIPPGSA